MQTIRALFFINSLAGGGAERACLNLAKQLHRLNIESDFITVYRTKSDYDIPEYVHIYSLGLDEQASPVRIISGMLCGVAGANAFLSEKEYTLITAHLPMSHILASLTKAGKKCLYVMQVSQRLPDSRHSLFYRTGLRLFLKGKKSVAVSKGLERELIEEYGIKSVDVTTIYNPCFSEEAGCTAQLVNPHERPYILVMGRLEEQKNPLLALELYDKGGFSSQYDLIYLGQGNLEKDLRKRIAEYHLQEHVHLKGFQKNPEQWLRNASLLLSCSRQEGLPLNLVEALVCGTPVVSADCPWGPDEILTDELAGYLIYPEKEQERSISVIASALNHYPEITQKYYTKFNAAGILQEYMTVWKRNFG